MREFDISVYIIYMSVKTHMMICEDLEDKTEMRKSGA